MIAVSGLELYTHNKLSESWYGSEVELSAPVGQRTTGKISLEGAWGETGGASSASTLVSAAATVVRSRYPHMRNYQVRDRLIWAAADVMHYSAGRDPQTGWGIVEMHKAVGGFYKVLIHAPGSVTMEPEPYDVTLTAEPVGGTGPFTYEWDDGPIGPVRTFTVHQADCNYIREFNGHVTDQFNGRRIPFTWRIHVTGATYCPNDDGTLR